MLYLFARRDCLPMICGRAFIQKDQRDASCCSRTLCLIRLRCVRMVYSCVLMSLLRHSHTYLHTQTHENGLAPQSKSVVKMIKRSTNNHNTSKARHPCQMWSDISIYGRRSSFDRAMEHHHLKQTHTNIYTFCTSHAASHSALEDLMLKKWKQNVLLNNVNPRHARALGAINTLCMCNHRSAWLNEDI